MPLTVVKKKKKASETDFLKAIIYIIYSEGQVIVEKYSESKIKEWIQKMTDAGLPCKYNACRDSNKIEQWMIYKTDTP